MIMDDEKKVGEEVAAGAETAAEETGEEAV